MAGAIGRAHPVSVFVETFGTGDHERAEAFVRRFDFRPAAIIRKLDLLRLTLGSAGRGCRGKCSAARRRRVE